MSAQTQNQPQPTIIEETRTVLRHEVKISGRWHWTDTELTPSPPAIATGNVQPMRRATDQQKPSGGPVFSGRDPGKHFVSISNKFKVHNMTIDHAAKEFGMDELNDMLQWARKKEKIQPLSANLEVTCEMIEAYLIEREFVPTPKNKQARPQR